MGSQRPFFAIHQIPYHRAKDDHVVGHAVGGDASGQVVVELRAAGEKLRLQIIEHLLG